MTKLIAILFLVAALFVGWKLFDYWDKVKSEEDAAARQKAAASAVSPQQLPGMPYQLEESLSKAEKLGATGLRNWLEAYGSRIEDPRKAWIQLDYVLLLSRDNPRDAKRLFAEVKARTPESSPVYPRIKELEKTYE